MKIFGLTGGIGSGKSTVATFFKQLSINVIDADQVAREVVAIGEPALAEIAKHFGQSTLLNDGNLDRAQLREIIFAEPAQKQWLEQLLHPRIRARIEQQLQQSTSTYTLLESPLLLETNQYELVEKVIVVDVDEHLQILRASQRDGASLEQIRKIMAAQLSRAERIHRADWIIDNSHSLAETQEQVAALHHALLTLSERN
jgi:dephospho-CoA kinase